jgi:curved DNA-binding protein CbpA
MAISDYYKILGIKYGATPDEIKRAYHRIAKRHHPDKNPNNKSNEEYFKQVSEAYNTLSDNEARKNTTLSFFIPHRKELSKPPNQILINLIISASKE